MHVRLFGGPAYRLRPAGYDVAFLAGAPKRVAKAAAPPGQRSVRYPDRLLPGNVPLSARPSLVDGPIFE